MSDLKKKSVEGIIWNLLEKIGVQIVKLVFGIILARILSPDDYGLVGMVTVFFAIAMVFIDSGFSMAFIQKKDATDEDASTIFYFNMIVSVFFYIVMWFSAPLIADFYEQKQLVLLVRVLSVLIIINSFGLIQFAKLKRDVNFKKITIIMVVSNLFSGIVGIVSALNGLGVWSLIIQQLVAAIIKNFGLWGIHKWRPTLVFKNSALKSMFSFSIWALFIGIVTTLFKNVYILVIGKYFSPAVLGFYTKAEQFKNFITAHPSDAFGTVAFPVLSKLQDDKKSFRNAVQKFNQYSLFIIAPICALFYIVAEPLFLLLLTEKWLPMVPYFKVLLIIGLLYPIHLNNVVVLNALAKMKLNFNLSMIKNGLRILNIIIMFRYGILYILYGEVFLSFMGLILNTYFTGKFVNYGFFKQMQDLLVILLGAFLLAVLGYRLVVLIHNDYLKIILGSVFVVVSYLLISYFLNKKLLLSLVDLAKEKLSSKKN